MFNVEELNSIFRKLLFEKHPSAIYRGICEVTDWSRYWTICYELNGETYWKPIKVNDKEVIWEKDEKL